MTTPLARVSETSPDVKTDPKVAPVEPDRERREVAPPFKAPDTRPNVTPVEFPKTVPARRPGCELEHSEFGPALRNLN